MIQARIYVAGHHGMVGSAIVRTLLAQGVPAQNIIGRTHAELDLCNQQAVLDFFAQERPTQVYLAAAKVGGIHANNTYPADFIYDNLMVQANVIHAAHTHGVQKLMFLGSSCIYPRLAPQPMREDALLTGTLEPTKRALCRRQNRRHQALRELQPPVWPRLPQRHADQPLWPGRQLPPAKQPRHPGAHPPLSRSQTKPGP